MTVDGSESSANVTGLLPGTEYTLRVVAVTMDGQISPPSVAIVVSTTVPGTVPRLSITLLLHASFLIHSQFHQHQKAL